MTSLHANGTSTDDDRRAAHLAQIQEALQIVHNPTSSNAARQEAFVFLENLKTDEHALYMGFTLANDSTQPPVVRHYALSLLELAIHHRWVYVSPDRRLALRGWLLELATKMSEADPLYLRNKTAQLWALLAERTWGSEWPDMDHLLVQLWDLPDGLQHKEFVLLVLEMLTEDIFYGEGTIAATRGETIKKSWGEIFTPVAVLSELYPNRPQPAVSIRSGDEGWLMRLGVLLDQCLNNDVQNNEKNRTCAVKILGVYRAVLPRAIPRAVQASHCVQNLCHGLASPSTAVQMASVEALHALYWRMQFTDEEFIALVCPMFTSDVVTLLRQLFEWATVSPHDIDDEKYNFAKKFSEMVSNLAEFVVQRPTVIPKECDIPSFLALLLSIVCSQSLVISIPILATWTQLLRSPTIGGSEWMIPLIGPLLQNCTSRMIRYESLPEDTDDPSMIFLVEDIDTIPERHVFLGNYRRYSVQVIELVVRQQTADAIFHILNQVDQAMQSLYEGQPSFSPENYSRHSIPMLRADAQCSVVEATLKGFVKWRSSLGSRPQEHESQRSSLEQSLEAWCERLLERNFEDPLIRKRVMQLAVAFSTTALDKNAGFMLKVLEYTLVTGFPDQPALLQYSDAVKELQSESARELQRLASKMPNHLLEVYDQLEAKINELTNQPVDTRLRTSYQTFLFTIILRAGGINEAQRLQRLEACIAPIQVRWQDPELETALSSFESFCDLMGMNLVRDYILSHRIHEVRDWSQLQLDAEGQALQAALEERARAIPLRATRSFLGASTDKIEKGTPEYNICRMLWKRALPQILPGVLKFLSHGHAFHNPANWMSLPDEVRPVISRILTDRFWQAGISEGSKDEFYARVTTTKSTMEGLASSIRGSIRLVRETCYAIIWCMSRMDNDFYSIEDLPSHLAHALYADAQYLSSHQLNTLMTMSRTLVEDCPPETRHHFIPVVLATLFNKLDAKISLEWEKLAQQQTANSGDDDELRNEMKEESILRSLENSTVMIAACVLDPAKTNISYSDEVDPTKFPSMRAFCLGNMTILEPLLMFLTHVIRMRDTRCCGIVLRIIDRSIIPEFDDPSKPEPEAEAHKQIREYISREVLMACISSLHEPLFVDQQRELASTIARIITHYASLTPTPRNVFLGLPGLNPDAIDRCFDYLHRPTVHGRQQRALVLDLLRDLKGVSVSEQGRINSESAPTAARRERSKLYQQFMKAPDEVPVKRAPSPDLEGVAGMFDV